MREIEVEELSDSLWRACGLTYDGMKRNEPPGRGQGGFAVVFEKGGKGSRQHELAIRACNEIAMAKRSASCYLVWPRHLSSPNQEGSSDNHGSPPRLSRCILRTKCEPKRS